VAAEPAFDERHPPDHALIDDCVHCGFCLPTCPTYVLLGEEMDSPRGRIYLMKEGLEGEPLTDAMALHFDRCLGCMACVTACPSGVRYDQLIAATRQQVERRHARSAADSAYRAMLFALFPYPSRLRAAAAPLALYQRTGGAWLMRRSGLRDRLPARLRALEALAPPTRAAEDVPGLTPAQGEQRARVGLLLGCVQRVFFSHVNAATARVLAAEGCEVVAPAQGCCGALSLHAGREDEAAAFARATIDAFEDADVDHVVVNAAGCGSAMKEYGHLLRDDPDYAERAVAFSSRVRDALEMLDELGPVAERAPLPLTVAYHDACHLRHAQGIHAQPRRVLRGIPGLELRDIAEGDLCCGSAGVYNLLEPDLAADLGERKARNVVASGAELLATANPGCLLQVRASLARLGERMPAVHPVELVDASLRGTPPDVVLRAGSL
jgi:glycolate oxidase iron-sulfur subunit